MFKSPAIHPLPFDVACHVRGLCNRSRWIAYRGARIVGLQYRFAFAGIGHPASRWEEWDRKAQHLAINRSVWHREIGTPKTEKSVRLVPVEDALREVLLDLWDAQGCPISGYILAGEKRKSHPVILDNLAKRVIRPALEKVNLTWRGWYALPRFHGTQARMHSNSETGAKALGNS